MSRPGAALLGSLVAAERRGKPGPAREAALAAARSDPGSAHEHLLDAVYASLHAGEPRRALQLLADVERVSDSESVRRRVLACRSWAKQLDRNWYPGDTGAELPDGASKEIPTLETVSPGEAETMLVESCVAQGPLPLLTNRSLISSMSTTAPAALVEMLASALRLLDRFKETAEASGARSLVGWANVAQADLLYRAGLIEEAHASLAEGRPRYQEIDPIGLAMTFLVEGDWWATPGSSPEALGFGLERTTSFATAHDDARAAAAYTRAGELLAGADAPSAAGALALRRAALAWSSGSFEEQIARLDAAQRAYALAGDEASLRLIVIHRLLCDVALGKVASTLHVAGTGWDHAPRGPIAEILAWGSERGSISFCAGLGRLLHRAGARWKAQGDFDRATAAYSMALPLISANGAIAPAVMLVALAEVDNDRSLPARSLVRLEQALASLSIPQDIGSQPLRWMQLADVMMSIVASQGHRLGTSAVSQSTQGLERSLNALETLINVADVPTRDVSPSLLRDKDELLTSLARAHENDSLTDLSADTGLSEGRIFATAAQTIREQVTVERCQLSLQRARLARRTGWDVEAHRWFRLTLDQVDAAGPQHRWFGVIASAAWGLHDDARVRFDDVQSAGLFPDTLLASLALRARAYETARSLLERLDAARPDVDLAWSDLADRAEAALECGDPDRALEIASKAIEAFETGVSRLERDPDRVAASDDIKAAYLYLVAARACLALADARAAADDEPGRQAALSRAFEWTDRGRSFALLTFVDDPSKSELPRHWQRAATEWSAAFERVLHAYERRSGASVEALTANLARAEETLAAIELDLETSRPDVRVSSHRVQPLSLGELRRHLPAGVCLIEYYQVGSDLLVMSVSADDLVTHYSRLDVSRIEALVVRFLRACTAGEPGDEAAELSGLLLDPVRRILAANERVIVVPFGPLYAVPFHALSFEGAPLGEHHVISYLPAASLLEHHPMDRPLNGRSAIVVGDPAFDALAYPSLRRLPGAAIEARVVGKLQGTDDVLIAGDAVEARLRTLMGGKAIVHLAAHGHLDEIAPSTSSLVLAGRDELTVADLIGLHIGAELAILSGCDTGRGNATLGGDIVGLGRGLLAAGVQRSVVSLWPVDDMVACVTMAAFHERLVQELPAARALAEAQRSIRTMSGEQLADRYRQLGGEPAIDTPSQRRGIALDPEFIDSDDSQDPPAAMLDGKSARLWAPFILLGT